MNKQKSWLWFVVPLAAIPICTVLLFLFATVSTDHYIGLFNYIRMTLDDSVFWKSFIKYLLIATGCCALICLIFYSLKILFYKKRKIYIADYIFMPISFVFSISAFYIPFYYYWDYLPNLNFSPYQEIIIAHITDYGPTRTPLIDLPLFIFSIWMGILICFLFWLLEKPIIKRINHSPTQGSQHSTLPGG